MSLVAMLDTNVVSALMRNPRGDVRRKADQVGLENVCVSVIFVGELQFGLEKSGSTRVAGDLKAVLEAIRVVPFAPPADEHCGRIRAHLEKRGEPIGPNDTWIAAHALALDLTLITANTGEFSRVPGLRIENWLD